MGRAQDALERVSEFGADRTAAAVVGATGLLCGVGDLELRFPLASVTKALVAFATLVAIEEHSTDLDAAVGPPGSTLRHLLSHASGVSPDDETRVLAPPGERRIYSSAGFRLLGRHLEERTGFALAEYVEGALFSPLGMRSAGLPGDAGAGGVASVADLVAFTSELLAPRLVSPQTLELARSVAFPGLAGVLPGFGRQDPCDFGLGFELRDHKSPHWTGSTNSPSTFGHFGMSGTFFWVDPSAGLALIVLTDRPFGDWAARSWPPFSDAVLAAFTFQDG